MRRADRLFDIIQALRTTPHPVTAAALAEQLEVTVRTIYRDIAALQGSRVPIEGAPGLGYVLRRGFDLPPLMFTAEEADAIAVGLRLLRRLRMQDFSEQRKACLPSSPSWCPRLYNRISSPRRFTSPTAARRRLTGSTRRTCGMRSTKRVKSPLPISTKRVIIRAGQFVRLQWLTTSM